jgi:hypothetical protein
VFLEYQQLEMRVALRKKRGRALRTADVLALALSTGKKALNFALQD